MADIAIAAISSFRVWHNRDWEYEYWSTGCEELFGYTVQELMADKTLWLSQVFPEDRETIVMPLFEAFFAKRNTTSEYRFDRKDGSVRWISSTYACQKIEDSCWTIVAVHHDISDTATATLRDRKRAEAELRQTEAEFRAMFNLTGVGMAQADIKTRRFLRVNATFCAITGYTEAELLALTVDDINHPDDRDRDREHDINLLHGDSYQSEKRYLRKDGSTVWVLATGNIIRDAAGQPLRAFAMIQDISDRQHLETERQAAAATLRASEERYRLVFESNPNPMWFYNPETLAFLEVNQAAIAHYGYSRSEFLQMTIADILPPTDVPALRQVNNHLVPGQPYVGVWQHCKKDGSLIDVEVTAYAFPVAGKQANLVLIEDITELKRLEAERQQAEAALRLSEEQRRLALDVTNTASWDWHLTTGAITWNVNHYRLLGYQPGEVEPNYQLWRDRVHPDDIALTEQKIAQALETQTDYEAEFRVILGDGSIRWMLGKGRGLYNEAGQPVRMLGIIFDISDRQRVEAVLRQSEAKYRSLFNSIDEGYVVIDVIFDENDQPIDLLYVDANPAAVRMSGTELVGKRTRELNPNFETQWFETCGRVVKTGIGERHEFYTAPLQAWYNFYVFKVGEPGSTQVGLIYQDVTERKRREANAAFLAEIAEDFSRLSSADEIMQTVGAKVGAYLDISNCLFAEIDEAQNRVTVEYNWHKADTPDAIGVDRLSDSIAEEFQQAARAGETVVIRNTQTDPRTDKDRYAAFKIQSFVTVPFHRGGEWKYLFTVNDSAARDWREDEIELIREVTNRSFSRLERARAEAALRENEQLLRLALAGARAGSWDWELATGKLTWSPETYHLHGLDPAKGLPEYEGWYDNLLHPDDRTWVNAHVLQAIEQRLPEIELEFRILHPQQGIRWLLSRGRPTLNDRGELIRLSGINLDISDRKQAELALQQQIQREQAIADISQDIRRSLDLNKVLSCTVERVRQLLNTDRVIIFRFRPDWQGDAIMESIGAEWIPILSTTIFDPCFEDRYIEPYRQGRIATITDIDTEDLKPCYAELLKPFQVKANLVIPLLQGEQLWGLLIAHQCSAPRQWQNAEIELLQQLANQVSIAIQQSELYQKIREQAALIDIATDAIFVRDLDNRILFWNQGAERLYGWTAEAALGETTHELFDGESASQLAENLHIAVEKGFWQGELEQVTKSGQEVRVASRWTLVRDESGQPKSILVVNSDITEKKQLEKQFYRAQRLESIGTLASGIAHDLNNILTPILAISHLLPLKFRNLDEQTRQMLELLEVSANRGTSLVKQVLSFSRGQEGQRVILQVGHLLSEVVSIANRTFPKSIQISTEIPTMELWTISADTTQIHQVLMNLIINARDAMPNGGSLTISAENRYLDENYAGINVEAKVGFYVIVSISDTGIGIPPELLERIFDPFFTTKEIGKGTGLGLATVQGIVKNHGGFVKVYSEIGNGTQFHVFLPACEGKLSQPIPDEELPIGNGELILIVDDEATIRQIAKTSLENYNYRTLFASDGIEALSLYAQHQQEISVVLIDLMMPNLDGLTAIRALQKMNPQVKAIATSGLASNSELALSVNVKTFLLKPYTIKDLLTALHEVISTTNSQTD